MFTVDLSLTKRIDVEPGQYVRCYGTSRKCIRTPRPDGLGNHVSWTDVQFEQTFRIGDRAVMGAYNLTYTGRVTSIGKKTVTIKDGHDTRRFTFERFASWNWNRDFEQIDRNNSETMQTI